MKQAQELIREIEKVGASIGLDTDCATLRIEAPRGALTSEQKDELAIHKQDIIQILKDIQKANQPYINEHGVLVIPFDGDPKYHWWAGGQSVLETLQELNASPEVIAMYGLGGWV